MQQGRQGLGAHAAPALRERPQHPLLQPRLLQSRVPVMPVGAHARTGQKGQVPQPCRSWVRACPRPRLEHSFSTAYVLCE